MLQNSLSRLWFLNHGCKQVPPDFIGGKTLWAHPDGYFLNAQGQKLAHSFSPASKVSRPNMHAAYPKMRCYDSRNCHIIMALAFYGPRPNYSLPLQGKGGERGSYPGIVHHIITDKLDYRPANLLCWLTREQHYEADRRQRALKKVVPDGDLRLFDIEWLRLLQDPRRMARERFQNELDALAAKHFRRVNTQDRIKYELTHHMEL